MDPDEHTMFSGQCIGLLNVIQQRYVPWPIATSNTTGVTAWQTTVVNVAFLRRTK